MIGHAFVHPGFRFGDLAVGPAQALTLDVPSLVAGGTVERPHAPAGGADGGDFPVTTGEELKR